MAQCRFGVVLLLTIMQHALILKQVFSPICGIQRLQKLPKGQEINSLLDSIKANIYKVYYALQEQENNVSAERVKNIFLGIEVKQQTLLELFKRHNEDVEKLVGINKSKATYQKYEVTRKHITRFVKEKYSLSDIPLKEINHMFISDFEIFLLTSCGCNSNTTAKFIQFLKRIILIARNNGWIVHDPFANYRITIKKVDRGYLTQEEVDSIIAKKMSTKRLDQVRDIFVFACYTGIVDKKQRKEKEGNGLIVRNECPLVALSAE